MKYYAVEDSLQAIFQKYMPLSPAQGQRIKAICMGVLLAGNSQMSQIARWLKQDSHQASRERWLKRVLVAPYMQPEYAYMPLVKHALAGYQASQWHLIMDRTHLPDVTTDLLSLNLGFRGRAIPLGWLCLRHGRSDARIQIALLERCRWLVPAGQAVIFHGDAEFDSIPLLQYVQQQRWDFIVGQSSSKVYRCSPTEDWQPLGSLPVTPSQAVYRPHIQLTKQHQFGPLSLFAFFQPHHSNRRHKYDIRYCVSSLPTTQPLRRLGRRRWEIEPFFRDYKSSGWQLQANPLAHPTRREGLLTVLAINYLWATCFGRWLCKTGQRARVDAHAQRHRSLFRLGWDYLVHQYRMDLTCPTLLTLYQ